MSLWLTQTQSSEAWREMDIARHAFQFIIGYLSARIWKKGNAKKITSCSMIYHFTVFMKQGGNQNNDASMPIEVISCFRGKGSLFPPVSLAINRFHLKDEISVVRYSFKSNHRQKSRTFRARKQLSAVYRITLRNDRISREFNIAAITARSAKKSVSYHDLYNSIWWK